MTRALQLVVVVVGVVVVVFGGAAALAGCAPKGQTLVYVTVAGSVTDARVLHVTAATTARSSSFDVTLAGAPGIPPARTFAIDVPPTLTGKLTLTITSAPTAVTAVTSVTLAPGARVDASLSLGHTVVAGEDLASAASDGGATADLMPLDTDMAGGNVAVQLVAPLSTTLSTTRRPTLRWRLPPGAGDPHARVCLDRAMSASCAELAVDGDGVHATPAADLPVGVVYWQVLTGSARTPSAVWQLQIPAKSATHATSGGSTLDVDGDGLAEVAVGAFDNDPAHGGPIARVYLYRGSTKGFGMGGITRWEPSPAANAVSDLFGYSVASAGDLNGDGYADFAIGAPGAHSGDGQVLIYFGGPGGIGATAAPAVGPAPSLTLTAPLGDLGGAFGSALVAAGDVDGDGYADLAVGAPKLALNSALQTGRVYIFYGGPDLGARVSSIDGSAAYASFGASLGAGDVNGDGRGDLLVGAPQLQSNLGRASLYLGSATLGNNPSAAATMLGNAANDQLGAGVALGDVNCDGLADVIVGSPGVYAVHIFHGALTGLAVPNPSAVVYGDDATPLSGGTADSQFGAVIAAGADFDGDGCQDLVVGEPGHLPGGALPFRGAGAGRPLVQNALTPGDATGAAEQFGSTLHLSDPTGHGLADVIIGDPTLASNPSTNSITDRVFFFLSVAGSGPVSGAFTHLSSPDTPSTRTGFAHAVY